jgi:hypothetical protein
MAGAVIIPRDVIEQLSSDPELLALMVFFVSRARYTPGKAAKGTDLRPGQLAIGKRLIAGQFRWTESKAYRAMTRLQDRNLIELRANREGTIVTLCNSERYRRFGKRVRTKSEPGPNPFRADGELTPNSDRTPIEKELKKKAPPPTPSDLDRWQEVGEKLRSRKVSCDADAIATAQTRGLTPHDVDRLIGEFDQNPDAWGPGALFDRITGKRSDWPPAAAKVQREQDRQRSLAGHLTLVANREQDDQRKLADDAWFAEMTAKHGRDVDQMTDAEIIGRLGDNKLLLTMYREKGRCRTIREQLFHSLENSPTEAVA